MATSGRPDKTARVAQALAKKVGVESPAMMPLTPPSNTYIAGIPISLRLVFPLLKPHLITVLVWCWLRAGKERVFYTALPSALLELGRSGKGVKDFQKVLDDLAELHLLAYQITSTGELQVVVLDPAYAIRKGLAAGSTVYAPLLGNEDLNAHAADVAATLHLDILPAL